MSAGSQHNLFYFSSLIFDRTYLPPLIFDIVFGLQETEAASADAHANLHSKLGFTQSFSRKITRTCVPLMVAHIWHDWDTAAMQSLVASIIQTMIMVHNIAGIDSYDEYDELRENCRVSAKSLLQGFPDTNNRGLS
jgi:hypothetical protein